MSSASFFHQPRRAVVFGMLVVLLHWMALGLLNANFGPPRQFAGDGGRQVMQAQVLSSPVPAPAEAAPIPLPESALPPPPLPEIAPLPLEAGVTPLQAGGPAPDALPAEVLPVAHTAEAVAAAPPEEAAQVPPAVEPAATPAAPELPRYTVDLPPSTDITMSVARTDADGKEWSGEALLSWKLSHNAYRIKVEAGIRVVFTRVNLVVLDSEGEVDATGFVPVKMTEKRRGRSLTATHFDWPGNKISFSASQATYPLAPGAQDKASVPLQLAAIARGDPKQLSGDIDILVGEDRDASVFRFQVAGQEEIDTKLGRLKTWRLTRPPKPGSYKSRLDIWLSPAHGWLPVQIRNTESKGAVTTQTVNNIASTQSGS